MKTSDEKIDPKLKSRPMRFDGAWSDCLPHEATHLEFKIPGPSPTLRLPVMQPLSATRAGTPNWSWNGDVEKPTLKPSIKTTGTDDSGEPYVCHTWVTDGVAQFLSDTTHELCGQALPLLDL